MRVTATSGLGGDVISATLLLPETGFERFEGRCQEVATEGSVHLAIQRAKPHDPPEVRMRRPQLRTSGGRTEDGILSAFRELTALRG